MNKEQIELLVKNTELTNEEKADVLNKEYLSTCFDVGYYREMANFLEKQMKEIGRPVNTEIPYLEDVEIVTARKYNPDYGDNRVCECGHTYYRHFDTYEDMNACGCKYCDCYIFEERK